MMIIGLPRSRTAWLSVFMSQSNTFFHHEAVNGCCNISEYRAKVSGCGDSTTAFKELLPAIKPSRVVVVKKNPDELERCINWCNNEYNADISDVLIRLDKRLDLVKGLVVMQSDINSRLKEIWEHLVDDKWLNRYSWLTRLNIQVNDTFIDEAAARRFLAGI